MLGLVRRGNYSKGTPIVLPHQFGNPVAGSHEPFGNVIPQSNATLDSNQVTWTPSPAHFGNQVGFLLQSVPPVVVVAPSSTGTVNINLTALRGQADSMELSYFGAPSGVTVTFASNPDTGTSVATVTVSAGVPAGRYTIAVIGTSGTEIDGTNIHLVVAATTGGGMPTQAIPTFSPVAGSYTGAQSVTITSAGATAIYYTTNGSTPTTSSTLYTGPVTVSTSETVKAIATQTGYINSAVGSAAYTIAPGVPALVAHAAAANNGTFAGVIATPAFDSTGANFLIAVMGAYENSASPSVVDSYGNTWHAVTRTGAPDYGSTWMMYCYNATVGAGHVVTATSAAADIGIAVMAFSGVQSASTPYKSEADSPSAISGVSTVSAGSTVTPAANDLVIAGATGIVTPPTSVTVDSGFTEVDIAGNSSAFAYAISGYLVSSGTTPVDPTWTYNTTISNRARAQNVVFAHA